MNLTGKFLFLSVFCCTVCLLLMASATAEFYEYKDKNGIRRFTDSPGKVPEAVRSEAIEHKDRYDYMTEEEREDALKKREEEISERRARIKREVREYQKKTALREAAEKKRKRLAKLRTKVTISNNQVLVPVTIKYKDKSISTTLLLDTGASNTVIHDDVAKNLGIESGKLAYALVAGGGVVKTREIYINSLRVGSKKLEKMKITILKNKGPSGPYKGLLGFDFLGRFKHTIDHKNQMIIWAEE